MEELFAFLTEHFGELLLGLEFLLLNLFGKKKTPEEKAAKTQAKEERQLAKKAKMAAKYLAKAQSAMPGVVEEKEVQK